MTPAYPPRDGDPQPIVDAASILLVDTAGAAPRLLMGQRQASNVFLPDKWVFPGGRLEAGDAQALAAAPLDGEDAAALLQALGAPPEPSFATALGLAAVRELFEETGHALAIPSARPADDLEHRYGCASWAAWAALGLTPSLAPLRFIARAITPPGRTRRYDTRFFVASRADAIEGAGPADGEFSRMGWFTLPEARELDLPHITRRILDDLEGALKAPQMRGPVPFYYQDGSLFRRDLIARAPAPSGA